MRLLFSFSPPPSYPPEVPALVCSCACMKLLLCVRLFNVLIFYTESETKLW